MISCSVVTEFLGSEFPCVNKATVRLTLGCDEGHLRELVACVFHARVAVEDDPAAVCLVCDRGGRPDMRVRFVSSVPLESEANRA